MVKILEQVKFLPGMTQAGLDFIQIKTRRSSVSEEERDLSAHMGLVLSIWRQDMGILMEKILRNNTPAIWNAMRRWINNYDDAIDKDRRYFPTERELKHYNLANGTKASDTTRELIILVSALESRSKQKEVYSRLVDLRRIEYPINFELSRELGASEFFNPKVEELKFQSSAVVMKNMVGVINIVNGIDKTAAGYLCEVGYYYYGMAGQLVDDLADFERDAGDPANLVVNASKQFADEGGLLLNKGYTRKNLKRCQRTLNYVNSRFNEMVSKIPPSLVQTRRSLEFFADLVPIYSIFETKTNV